MNRDLSIVAEKEKKFYELKLPNGKTITMRKPTLEFYFRIQTMKEHEMNIETMGQSVNEGIEILVDYLNTNIEGEKFNRDLILKDFELEDAQKIIGDMWRFSMGIDNEKN